MKIISLITFLVNNSEIQYVCIDQHVDATFNNVIEAQQYADYYKPHHNYKVYPIITFKN
jgi:hypothetical protein|tara:strand:- start:22 stop:198 length:177 start_codon:yes stop_codon:yes gene_type:complete